jgi:hypothetical protein
LELKYRDVEYTVVQGLGRQLWKWGFVLQAKPVTSQAATKAEGAKDRPARIQALSPGFNVR